MRAAAVFRFHFAAGARLALRAASPIVAFGVAAVGLQHYPEAALRSAAEGLIAPAGTPPTLAALALAALVAARWAVPRVAAGAGGWIAHLPIGADRERRALAAAVALAALPVSVCGVALWGMGRLQGLAPGPAELAALALMPPLAAYAVLPFRRARLAHAAALAGLCAAFTARPAGLAAAVAALGVAEAVAGPVRAPATITTWRALPRLAVPAAITLRASGAALPGAYLRAALPVAAGAFMLRNNPLAPAAAGVAARLAGGVALALLVVAVVARIDARRPAWGWARSLPWSARQRVAADARLLFALCAPVLAAVVALRPSSGLALVPLAALVATLGARALRVHRGGRYGAAGPLAGECLLAAAAVGVAAPLVFAALAVLPFALRDGVRAEQDTVVGRFDAERHEGAGDPASPTGR